MLDSDWQQVKTHFSNLFPTAKLDDAQELRIRHNLQSWSVEQVTKAIDTYSNNHLDLIKPKGIWQDVLRQLKALPVWDNPYPLDPNYREKWAKRVLEEGDRIRRGYRGNAAGHN